MKIIDVSLPVSPAMPVWPGDPPVELERIESMDEGADANVSRLSAGVHVGTHVDAPHHFLNDNRTVESLSLDTLTGPCCLVHFPDELDLIDGEALERAGIPEGTRRVLFRTRNSRLWARGEAKFEQDFVAVSEDGARWLVEHGLHLVGVDYLSVAPYGNSVPTHAVLLTAGVVVVEGLDLSAAPSGAYELYCLPLKLAGSDGAPARAILVQR